MSAEIWQEQAACKGEDPELFFSSQDKDKEKARAICAGCKVRAECLDYALITGELHGIWGGLDERERGRILRARAREAATQTGQVF